MCYVKYDWKQKGSPEWRADFDNRWEAVCYRLRRSGADLKRIRLNGRYAEARKEKEHHVLEQTTASDGQRITGSSSEEDRDPGAGE